MLYFLEQLNGKGLINVYIISAIESSFKHVKSKLEFQYTIEYCCNIVTINRFVFPQSL